MSNNGNDGVAVASEEAVDTMSEQATGTEQSETKSDGAASAEGSGK